MSVQLDTIISILIGGLLTWLAAHLYYVQAAREMKAESEKLRNLQRISLEAMEDAGMVKINRDPTGAIIGMVHELFLSDTISLADTANLTALDEVKERRDSKRPQSHPDCRLHRVRDSDQLEHNSPDNGRRDKNDNQPQE